MFVRESPHPTHLVKSVDYLIVPDLITWVSNSTIFDFCECNHNAVSRVHIAAGVWYVFMQHRWILLYQGARLIALIFAGYAQSTSTRN